MSPFLILGIFLIYTIVLFSVTWFTARKADNQSFFIGNKVSPWFVVAYGMIGASLSGVTFMSVPGWVRYSVQLYGCRIWIFVWLSGNRTYPSSNVLQIKTYIYLCLPRTKVRIVVIQNRCRFFHPVKDTGSFPPDVSCY